MLHLRRALQDMGSHRLLNLITVITVAMTIMIIGAAGLLFLNVGDLLNTWKQGLRIQVYLANTRPETDPEIIAAQIRALEDVAEVHFIPRSVALERLRDQMSRQAAILDHLDDNPLPDAFDVRMVAARQSWERIESLARQIEALDGVEDVEYGQRWVGRFMHLFNLFQISSYAMGTLLAMASVFIVGNTIRLVYYSRREEVEIMRLVGATDRFILTPFYIQGMIQGLVGGAVGLAILYFMFTMVSARVAHASWLELRFLPIKLIAGVVCCSALVGGLGCHLSLKQHFRS